MSREAVGKIEANFKNEVLKNKKMKQKIKKISKTIFIVAIVLTLAMFWYDQALYYTYNGYSVSDFEERGYYGEGGCAGDENVALIKVQGEIVTYDNWYGYGEGYENDIVSSEMIVGHIKDAETKSNIRAIIIEIDSYGGLLVASEEVMNALKRSNKLTLALIREAGVSGGYLVATGADYIFASELSSIGGIGVTMSYLDYSDVNKKEGIAYQELSSAKFKDTGSADKELTEEEKDLLMRDIIEAHNIFVEKIAENRGLEKKEVEKIADGSSMMGSRAKEKGLVDDVGDIYKVKEMIKERLNITPKICYY